MSSKKGVAVITGASRGIGAAAALRLADDGFRVVFNYSSSEGPAREVVGKIEAKHGAGQAIAVKANIGSVKEAEDFAAEAQKYGPVTFLLINAAVAPVGNINEITIENYDETFDINVKGHLFLLKALTPKMPDGSSITIISTIVTRTTNIGGELLLYISSKGAIEQAARVLAKELGQRSIRVNVLQPGPIMSDMFRSVANTPEIAEAYSSISPMKRVGEPEEVASVVSFLAGPDSKWVSGQVIGVDGAATV